MTDTPSERAEKQSIVEDLTDIARRIWSDAVIDKFGSFATGLSVANSDIDLVVLSETYEDCITMLGKFADECE